MSQRSRALEVMIGAARTAGAGLMRDFGRPERLHVDEKGPSDFVSTADLVAQEALRAALSAAYPDHALLMEEGDHGGGKRARARFIVDPLDGTTNFLRGMPHFAVTVALEEDGDVVSGLVLDVPKDELFWAEKGRGAWLGETPVRVARPRELSRSVIGTGIPHRGHGDHRRYLAALGRVMQEVAGIRRLGSAALDLCYVAAGRFDAFFERGLSPWDVAAGILIVKEAGGVVTRSDGSAASIDGRDVLACSSEPLQARMTELLEPLHVHSAAEGAGFV